MFLTLQIILACTLLFDIKNLYSLQNAQSHAFIFQLICMQLCKCINCFLKTHNKQLNQYCLNFTIFFIKIFFLNGSGSGRVTSRVGLTHKKHGLSYGSTYFCFGSKKSGLGRVFFGSGQKILTRLPCLIVYTACLLMCFN